MGIERARVVEVHARTSATGRVGSGYLISDRLVLTADCIVGRQGPTEVRPGGTFPWVTASLLWLGDACGAAVLEVDDPSTLMVPPAVMRWGEVLGGEPVPVTAMGFPPVGARPDGVRDPEQIFGQLGPPRSGGDVSLPVTARAGRPPGDGMCGAVLFAGAELVGVIVAGPGTGGDDRLRAVPVGALAGDDAFVGLVGGGRGLTVTPVRAPPSGFSILPAL